MALPRLRYIDQYSRPPRALDLQALALHFLDHSVLKFFSFIFQRPPDQSLPLVEIPNDSETVTSQAGDGSPGILHIGIGSHTGLSGSSAS
jgi:hypothetical protein